MGYNRRLFLFSSFFGCASLVALENSFLAPLLKSILDKNAPVSLKFTLAFPSSKTEIEVSQDLEIIYPKNITCVVDDEFESQGRIIGRVFSRSSTQMNYTVKFKSWYDYVAWESALAKNTAYDLTYLKNQGYISSTHLVSTSSYSA